MRAGVLVVERDEATGLFVGYAPHCPGGHSQGATIPELVVNRREVVGMLRADARGRSRSARRVRAARAR